MQLRAQKALIAFWGAQSDCGWAAKTFQNSKADLDGPCIKILGPYINQFFGRNLLGAQRNNERYWGPGTASRPPLASQPRSTSSSSTDSNQLDGKTLWPISHVSFRAIMESWPKGSVWNAILCTHPVNTCSSSFIEPLVLRHLTV